MKDRTKAFLAKSVFSLLAAPVLAFLMYIILLGIVQTMEGNGGILGILGVLALYFTVLGAWLLEFWEFSTFSDFRLNDQIMSPTRLLNRGRFKSWRNFRLDDVVGVHCEIHDAGGGEKSYAISLHLPDDTTVQVHSVDIRDRKGSERIALESIMMLCDVLKLRHESSSLEEMANSVRLALRPKTQDSRSHG